MLKIADLALASPTILAPMAELTDTLFRMLIDEIGGCGLLVTEMVSVEALRRRNRRTWEMIRPFPARTPQFVQLFGGAPEAFAEATRMVTAETGYHGIDINMGCPAPKVTRNFAGAFLLNDPPRMAAVIRAVRQNTGLPLTVKMRLGLNEPRMPELAHIAEAEGADAVAVHFRLKKDGYAGQADWSYAPIIKQALRIPFIGNGDITIAAQAREWLRVVDGVMIGRGAVANPYIFREVTGEPVTAAEGRATLHRLCALIESMYPEKYRAGKLKAFVRFLKMPPFPGGAVRKRIFLAQTYPEARDILLASIA